VISFPYALKLKRRVFGPKQPPFLEIVKAVAALAWGISGFHDSLYDFPLFDYLGSLADAPDPRPVLILSLR